MRERRPDSVWFTWSAGGHRQMVLTPWAVRVLSGNTIPAAERERFVRELRYFLARRQA